MQLKRAVFAAAMSLTMAGGALTAIPASANGVDVWMTVATNHPAVGCEVETNVEVRSGGEAMSGADVTINLSNDGEPVLIDSTSGTTDGSGIAYLSFSTSGADVTKTWLEVRVNGAYIGGRTIWVDGTACDGATSVADFSGDAPVVTNSVEPATTSSTDSVAVATSGSMFLSPVYYVQQRNLSCEYAAVQIATSMIGAPVTEYQMEAQIGLSDNPHWGYRGNISGWWGNTDDYGIYNEPLANALAAYGLTGYAFYGDPSDLMASIDSGRPTLVWLGMRGDYSQDLYTSDGTRYMVNTYMHVMTVYGYDESGVYLSDPATGNSVYYDWATFNWMWQVMDGMALGVGY